MVLQVDLIRTLVTAVMQTRGLPSLERETRLLDGLLKQIIGTQEVTRSRVPLRVQIRSLIETTVMSPH